MKLIRSRQNSLIKHIKALDKKKYRDTHRQFFIEGAKLVIEAIKENVQIECILVSTEFDWDYFKKTNDISEDEFDIFFLEAPLFDYIARTKTPQGIAAIINKPNWELYDMLGCEDYFIAILDGVQDPGNVGTIMRTLDGAGASGVILLEGSADPYSSKAIRASMGSIFRIPVCEIEDEDYLFSYLTDRDTHIMISHLEGNNLFDLNEDYEKIALVIGNEGRGVRKELLKYASSIVKIPLLGRAESLNASVASGIIIYEIVRKKLY